MVRMCRNSRPTRPGRRLRSFGKSRPRWRPPPNCAVGASCCSMKVPTKVVPRVQGPGGSAWAVGQDRNEPSGRLSGLLQRPGVDLGRRRVVLARTLVHAALAAKRKRLGVPAKVCLPPKSHWAGRCSSVLSHTGYLSRPWRATISMGERLVAPAVGGGRPLYMAEVPENTHVYLRQPELRPGPPPVGDPPPERLLRPQDVMAPAATEVRQLLTAPRPAFAASRCAAPNAATCRIRSPCRFWTLRNGQVAEERRLLPGS